MRLAQKSGERQGRTVQQYLYRTKEDMAKVFLSIRHHRYALTSLAMKLHNLRLSSCIVVNAAFKAYPCQAFSQEDSLTDYLEYLPSGCWFPNAVGCRMQERAVVLHDDSPPNLNPVHHCAANAPIMNMSGVDIQGPLATCSGTVTGPALTSPTGICAPCTELIVGFLDQFRATLLDSTAFRASESIGAALSVTSPRCDYIDQIQM